MNPLLDAAYYDIAQKSGLCFNMVNRDAIQFAEACFDQNTIEDLRDETPDAKDCKEWGISPEAWLWAILTARYAKQLEGNISSRGEIIL